MTTVEPILGRCCQAAKRVVFSASRKTSAARAVQSGGQVGRLGDHQQARRNDQRVERSGLPPGRRLRPAMQHEQYQAYPQGTEQYQRPGDKATGHEAVVGIG